MHRLILWCALVATVVAPAVRALGSETLQWSGFLLLRAVGEQRRPSAFDDHPISSQLQLGIDWRPAVAVRAHLHLIARSDSNGSRRGNVGTAEAFVEVTAHPGAGRLRILGGAFFLPGSQENLDELWESPYSITSSALSSWLGEEFRPIGIDTSFRQDHFNAGVTLFRGNDTLGALPADRGWSLRDHWALLGEWLPADDTFFSSVSAETDHRLGWAGRGGWSNDSASVELTHFDNRGDALPHGLLYGWRTDFSILSASWKNGDWTVTAENGWGPTRIRVGDATYRNDLQAGYLLVSRRVHDWRFTIRGERFTNGETTQHAWTAASLWQVRRQVRAAIEITQLEHARRAEIEVRYRFGG